MSVLYTVGYEGTDIERFIRTLTAMRIARVADVRAVAVSRKAGFSKSRLSARLAAANIAYTHFVDLGDPKPGRDAARAGEYERFRSIYGAHLRSDAAQVALTSLIAATRIEATCLLCFERDPDTCHRTIVANEVARATGADIHHLFADDPERYVRNAGSLPRFHTGEGLTAA